MVPLGGSRIAGDCVGMFIALFFLNEVGGVMVGREGLRRVAENASGLEGLWRGKPGGKRGAFDTAGAISDTNARGECVRFSEESESKQ